MTIKPAPPIPRPLAEIEADLERYGKERTAYLGIHADRDYTKALARLKSLKWERAARLYLDRAEKAESGLAAANKILLSMVRQLPVEIRYQDHPRRAHIFARCQGAAFIATGSSRKDARNKALVEARLALRFGVKDAETRRIILALEAERFPKKGKGEPT